MGNKPTIARICKLSNSVDLRYVYTKQQQLRKSKMSSDYFNPTQPQQKSQHFSKALISL